jgi:16S rRNA (guanine527-N7)-methyltransferase
MNIIEKYFPNLTETQKKQFGALPELYEHWNAQINVISRKDIEFLYEKHILHSLAIAKVIQFKYGTNIADIGTGGGFPGIPLAIMFPDVSFHLADSIGKKIKVVSEIANALELKNVKAEQIRAEQMTDTYDFIVSRGVARLIELKNWSKGKIAKHYQHTLKNGLLCLKGGDLEEEIKESGLKNVKSFPLSDYFSEEFFETKQVIYAPLS